MLEKLRASFAGLNPRSRRLLLVALGLAALLVLNRTVVSGVVGYENRLDSTLEDLQAKLQKIQQKIAKRGDYEARRQLLQSRLGQEAEFLLPYGTPAEAQNMLNACLQNLAYKSSVELANVQTMPVQELGETYQRVSVRARATARTQHWTQFLYEIEALRSVPQGGDAAQAHCPPLPLSVDELTVRVSPGKQQHDANVMILVSGILRKPQAPETGNGQ